MGAIYAGTSGFSYPAWRGGFYPKTLASGEMLRHYATRLNGVELNQSFYHLPQESVLRAWADATGEDFRFCLKAPRGLTYSAAAFDKGALAEAIGSRLVALGERRGPVLVQWPASRPRDDQILDLVLRRLGLRAAVEFRHPSWFQSAVYDILSANGAALVVADDEKWPPAPSVEIADFAYYRLRRDYSAADLERWAEVVAARAAVEAEVHVYFKHDLEGPERALALLRTLA